MKLLLELDKIVLLCSASLSESLLLLVECRHNEAILNKGHKSIKKI